MIDKKTKEPFPLTNDISVSSTSQDVLKFKVDGKIHIVPRSSINAMLFYFGTDKQQEDTLKVKKTKVVMERRALTLKAKKDIKKGEKIEVFYEYPASAEVIALPQKSERLGHTL